MTVQRMDNVGIVVDDLDAAVAFFIELGLDLEGRAPVEGDWADGVAGLRGMQVEVAMTDNRPPGKIPWPVAVEERPRRGTLAGIEGASLDG